MDDILKLFSEYGILIVIAAVFIWDKLVNAKQADNILKELQEYAKLQGSTLQNLDHTCRNMETALSIIQSTLAANTQSLERHDKRSEYMNNDIREIVTILHTRPCVTEHMEESK